MKKISAVLLVLVLVGSVAFASFTGNAAVSALYNLDNGELGTKNSTNLKGSVTAGTELGEAIGEGDIYASITADLELGFGLGRNGVERMFEGDDADLWYQASISEAKIFGEDWSVSVLGITNIPSFAVSTIDTIRDLDWDGYDADPVWMPVNMKSKLPRVGGVTATYGDFTIGFGAYKPGKGYEITGTAEGYLVNDAAEGDYALPVADADLTFDYTFYGAVTDMEVMDGIKLSAGVGFGSKTSYDANTDSATFTWVPADEAYTVAGVTADISLAQTLVAGGKVDAEFDTFSVMAAGDVNYDVANSALGGIEGQIAASTSIEDFDIALDIYGVHGPVINDSYEETTVDYTKHISAKATVGFDPFTVTLTGKDLINTQDLKGAVDYAATEELTVGGYFGFRLDDNRWSAGASAKYALAQATVAGGFDLYKVTGNVDTTNADATADSIVIKGNASVVSTTLVPGAELKLAWAGDDLTGVREDYGIYGVGDMGKITASAKIAF